MSDAREIGYVIRHVMICGRVQRVGFRNWAEYTALAQGLEGWVRNRTDGAVEAVFAGPAPAVEEMIEACRHGPPGARVDAIDQRDGTLEDFARRRPGDLFSVLPTG